jgi:hypothetical protein
MMTEDPKSLVPSSYVIHYRFVQCSHCGHASRESTFYSVVYLRPRGGGKPARHLVPCDRPRYNLPVNKQLTAQLKIPFCQACDSVDLSHLPPPPSGEHLYDLAEPTAKPPKAAETTKRPPPRRPSILDLA